MEKPIYKLISTKFIVIMEKPINKLMLYKKQFINKLLALIRLLNVFKMLITKLVPNMF